MAPSSLRQRALAIVDAYNRMDTQGVASYRASHCIREIRPASLGYAPQDNAEFTRYLNMCRVVFRNFEVVVHDVVEDAGARKVCLWLTARADTMEGKYECDMVWSLAFDEHGKKVVRWKEFVDANNSSGDFMPDMMGPKREG